MASAKRQAAAARGIKRASARIAAAEAKATRARVRIEAAELRDRCKVRRIELRAARRAALVRLREERAAARVALREQYRRAIEDARADADRARAALRGACASDAAALRREVAEAQIRARAARVDYRDALAELRGNKPRRMNIAERRAHELNQAEHDFPEPWERALLAKLYRAGKVKASARRSLSEAFAEWMHDHSADAATFRADFYEREADELYQRETERERELAERAPSAWVMRDEEIPF